ncbi:glycoside hydrolase family 3 C-terminal domain-containing protein [Streptomonospora sp. S1-112]|uniref:Glycoside hydrolase family 3 C-terminal domain-containing protein n=1 Tax=Streptomonospora mangrovi TaxID=2883123 RepID=A0A9X3NZS1_9ACTN|nr:glycoside hydrolase family 3 C-terminal domain-containing protein [Streptomonospora mangrovi]MDA0567276.1 glycoside hydrolase family 3 C-terminal domain-containing protein [Streptomonospora mangrovi]
MTTHLPSVHPAEAERERHVEAALARLDLTGKVRLLSGATMWAIAPNPEIGLDRLVMSDGPVGVRGERWTPEDPSVQLPSPTALAATWDPDLVRTAGHLLAQEARRKGVHVLLAPTVNIHRSPLGGRHFECYSEDPHLTGRIGAAYVAGVQEGGVGTTVKHFVANDSETDRFTVDVRVDERTLREIYLAPFEAIVAEARPWGVMAAYNSVNGTTMTEHADLNAVLRDEWGFDGFIVSDWTAARDTVGCALAGLDVAMPGPATVYGEHLVAAVREGRVPEAAVDAMARRVLRLAARVGALEGAEPVVKAADLPAALDGRAVARRAAARSFTLLRNEGGALPIDPARVRSVALIGLAADEARTSGGGSATVFSEHTVSPLEGLRAALPDHVRLDYAVGADPRRGLPPLRHPLTAVFRAADGTELGTERLADGAARWIGELPPGIDAERLAAVEVTGTFTPQTTGTHVFGVTGVGHFTLTVDGEVRFDGDNEIEGTDPAAVLLNPPQSTVEVELTAGRPVPVSATTPVPEGFGGGFPFIGFALNHLEPRASEDELIEEAVAAAAAADVAIVVAATTEQVESEGFDRADLRLPGRQDELVARVAAANDRTVVVVNAGSPVLMPWREDAAAVLVTWFGGQEVGAALADVLLGAEEPGGRLPTTWPAEEADVPVIEVRPTDGRLVYDEGVFVGYRAWQRAQTPPAYWFGHGLGYTTWDYTGVEARPAPDGGLTVTVGLANTGERAGREVVQVYLEPHGGAAADTPERPRRWLAGFAAVSAEPGARAEAVVAVPPRAAQVWDTAARAWRTVPGGYDVVVGRSAGDTRLRTAVEIG